VTPSEWANYIVGQLNIPDPEQREWLKRQVCSVAADATEELRTVLEKISKRRPVTDEAGNAFYRSRQDAKDVLAKFKHPPESRTRRGE
jgi:hypothetical protein